MEQNNNKNTADNFSAVNENITPIQLLQEIEPLLKEYFIGEFEVVHNSLNMRFKNGQSFILKICEIV